MQYCNWNMQCTFKAVSAIEEFSVRASEVPLAPHSNVQQLFFFFFFLHCSMDRAPVQQPPCALHCCETESNCKNAKEDMNWACLGQVTISILYAHLGGQNRT